MIFRIYSEKSNTIASGSNYEDLNSSQNPATDLWYGGIGASRNSISRHLLYFNIETLQEKINSKEINPAFVTGYKLRLKNCIPSDKVLDPEYEFNRLNKTVASSFDLIAFPINKFWDEGRGFDLEEQKTIVKARGNPILSGYSNWLSATSLSSWTEPGVFTNPTASTTNWSTQHFSIGNEDIYMDITSIVNDWLSGGSENNGIALAYAKYFEDSETENRNISTFFTNKTNTAFKPFIEVQYNQSIKDDRVTVSNNRPARLFLYLFSGNSSANYFSAGTVTIKNSANAVVYSGLTPTQFTKGVYYVDVLMSGTTKGQRFYDVWEGITMSPGLDKTDYTQKFDIQGNYFSQNASEVNDYVVNLYGISNNETIIIGDVKRLYAETRVNYSLQHPKSDYGLEYRLTMNTGVEIVPWTPMNSVIIDNCLKSYLDIDTNILLDSQTYEITLRINELGTKRTLQDRTIFKVVDSFDKVVI